MRGKEISPKFRLVFENMGKVVWGLEMGIRELTSLGSREMKSR